MDGLHHFCSVFLFSSSSSLRSSSNSCVPCGLLRNIKASATPSTSAQPLLNATEILCVIDGLHFNVFCSSSLLFILPCRHRRPLFSSFLLLAFRFEATPDGDFDAFDVLPVRRTVLNANWQANTINSASPAVCERALTVCSQHGGRLDADVRLFVCSYWLARALRLVATSTSAPLTCLIRSMQPRHRQRMRRGIQRQTQHACVLVKPQYEE